MSRQIVLADLETGSLYHQHGELWEVGALEYGEPDDPSFRRQHLYRIDPDRAKADGGAMGVNGFYERTQLMVHQPFGQRAHNLAEADPGDALFWSDPGALALRLAHLLAGKTLITSVLTFDVPFLNDFLAASGQVPGIWHFRTRDFCSIVHGWLRGKGLPCPPLDAGTADYAEAAGVDPSEFLLHSALGDVLLMGACLDVITGVA